VLLTSRLLLYALFPPSALGPPLTYFLAISDQIGGAVIAGVFSLLNTALLVVLTVRLRIRRKDDEPEEELDHANGGG